jgi:hypothetical protein
MIIQYAVGYEFQGEYFFLESAKHAQFITWFPVNNLYATIELAWWDLYHAIEHGLEVGIQLVGDRATDVELIVDHNSPLFYIGNYKIIPVSLEMNFNNQISARNNLKELHE